MQSPEREVLRYHIPHPGQAVILNHPARFRVVACGRRFGKTELAKLDVIITAQDGGVAWWVLPTFAMAQDVMADMVRMLEPMEDVKINKTERTFRFANAGEIAIKSGHVPDRLRGSGLDSLVIDEAAFCSEEVWHTLRPALADRGGRALLLSTPYGRNWFWQLYQKGVDPLEPEWASWRMPTLANPFIPPAEIEAARHDIPTQKFRQEYEAEFLENTGNVFHGVRECVRPAPAYVSEPVCFGVDWGRSHDYTAVVVMGMISRQVLAMDRFTDMAFKLQRLRLKKLAKHWKPSLILAEANSIGAPNIEAL